MQRVVNKSYTKSTVVYIHIHYVTIKIQHGHAWNTVVISGLVLLVATWNCQISYKNGQICRIVGPSLAASLETLSHCRNVASLNLSYRNYFDRSSSELAELVPLPYSRGGCTRYLTNCMISLSPLLDVTRCLCQQFLSSHS